MSEIQYNYVLDRWRAFPTAPWIDVVAATTSTSDNRYIFDMHAIILRNY